MHSQTEVQKFDVEEYLRLAELLKLLYSEVVDYEVDLLRKRLSRNPPLPHAALIEVLLELAPVLLPVTWKIALDWLEPRIYITDAVLELSYDPSEGHTFYLGLPASLVDDEEYERLVRDVRERDRREYGEGELYLEMKFQTPDFTASRPSEMNFVYIARGRGICVIHGVPVLYESKIARKLIERHYRSVKLLEEVAKHYLARAQKYLYVQD